MSTFEDLMKRLDRLFINSQLDISNGLSSDMSDRVETETLSCGIMNTDEMNACRCFIVEFVGKDAGGVNLDDFKNMDNMVDRVGGSLASEVRKFLSEEKANVTEQGGGVFGWHLGALCTPGQAWLLMSRGRVRFEKALQSGLLNLRMFPWSVSPNYRED